MIVLFCFVFIVVRCVVVVIAAGVWGGNSLDETNSFQQAFRGFKALFSMLND
jgi:uncharacterized membrane protein